MLTELQSKWVDFDTAGKEMYLEQVRRVRCQKPSVSRSQPSTYTRSQTDLELCRDCCRCAASLND